MRKNTSKTINKTKQKKREEFQYKYLMATIAIGVIYHFFFESYSIGSDTRYDVFVFWLPVIIGLILIVSFNVLSIDWNDILPTIKKERNIFYKIIYFPFLVLMHFMLSIIIFWIPADIIWDNFNRMESNKNQTETYITKADKFQRSTGRSGSNKIYFSFKGKSESIRTSFKDIKPFLEKNPNDYEVIVDLKKGIWNYYVLQSWDIKEVSN